MGGENEGLVPGGNQYVASLENKVELLQAVSRDLLMKEKYRSGN